MKAFALVYGPLPGVRPPKGRAAANVEGTEAMGMVARVWDQLTPEQRQAVDAALGAPHDATSARTGRVPRQGQGPQPQVLTPSPQYQAIIEKWANVYRAKLPGVEPAPIRVFTASQEIVGTDGGTAYADALPVGANGEWGTGPIAYCRVRVPPLGQKQKGAFKQLVLAHETFHCFQFAINPGWPSLGLWIREGMADWAATSVVPATAAVGAGPYKGYLGSFSSPLFSRSYGGTGFWHWADEVAGVGSLWPKVFGILTAASNEASFAAAGGTTPAFVQTWASAAWRLNAAGASWHQARPYDISNVSLASEADIVTSGTALTTEPYQARDAMVSSNPDMPLVELTGLEGQFRAAESSNDYGLITQPTYFCWGKCKCPPKSDGKLPPHQKVKAAWLATGLTGGAAGAQAHVTYHSLDEFCKKKDDDENRKPSGPGETNGDPHLTSWDGLHFDFQAAGEFLLARSGAAISRSRPARSRSRTPRP